MMFGRGYAGDYGCFGYGYLNNGWDLFIGLSIIAIIGAVIYLLVKRNNNIVANHDVMEILNLKFAKGELTTEEYIQRKKVLNDK